MFLIITPLIDEQTCFELLIWNRINLLFLYMSVWKLEELRDHKIHFTFSFCLVCSVENIKNLFPMTRYGFMNISRIKVYLSKDDIFICYPVPSYTLPLSLLITLPPVPGEYRRVWDGWKSWISNVYILRCSSISNRNYRREDNLGKMKDEGEHRRNCLDETLV